MAADGAAECRAEAKEADPWPPQDTTAALMRTLRMDRAGSTESAVVTSGVESAPSSPSRPVTPGCCPRSGADSEDSGLGPSPAKCDPPAAPLALDEALRRFLMEDGSSSSTGSQEASSSSLSSSSSGSGQQLLESEGCKWLHCTGGEETDLLGHLRKCHVAEQEPAETFVCLWVGCKVFDRPSCSRSWLERHVLSHGGSKPFACIVAGCRQRFGTEGGLQRHVNSHFHAPARPSQHQLRRLRRHKRRRRPQDNKSKDFFDDATMEHIRHNLFQLSSVDGISSGGPPSAITFHSSVVARRVDKSGRVNVLLRWSPEDVLPDSWVSETDLLSNAERSIPVSQLPPQALPLLPCVAALTKAGVLPRPAKRKRK